MASNRLTSGLVTVRNIYFRNYKAFGQFAVSLQHINVLVGPNNCGKSTLLGALRILQEALRQAKGRAPEPLATRSPPEFGYRIREEFLPITIENLRTNYEETETSVTFVLSNANRLRLHFPRDGGCFLIAETDADIRKWSLFERAFPLSVAAIPVLGPVEHGEEVLTKETVQKGLSTHRASRHFRNYWRHFPEAFEAFAAEIRATWPGMEVGRPEAFGGKLQMFVSEERLDRELYWSGFGFQIWCQLLTHIIRLRAHSVLLVDEPDVYLHADLQRRLLSILRDAAPTVVLATHSTEIIGEAEPGEIVLINKSKRSAERLRDVKGVQLALDNIGSIQNITLARLAKSRRVIFVEGAEFKLLRRFAKILEYKELAEGSGIVDIAMDGFSGWKNVSAFALVLRKTLPDESMKIAVLLDRDYRSDTEVEAIRTELLSNVTIAHILQRKEIENYLLVIPVLERAVRARARESKKAAPESTVDLLMRVTDPMRDDVFGQLVARNVEHAQKTGDRRDVATITIETNRLFDQKWNDLSLRIQIVPGKRTFSGLLALLQAEYGYSVTAHAVIASMSKNEVPPDLASFISDLEHFRVS